MVMVEWYHTPIMLILMRGKNTPSLDVRGGMKGITE